MHLTALTRKATPCNAVCHVALHALVRFVRSIRYVEYVRGLKTYKTTVPQKKKNKNKKPRNQSKKKNINDEGFPGTRKGLQGKGKIKQGVSSSMAHANLGKNSS